MVVNQEDIAYGLLVILINERFSGEGFRRKLEAELPGIIFENVKKINEFSNNSGLL